MNTNRIKGIKLFYILFTFSFSLIKFFMIFRYLNKTLQLFKQLPINQWIVTYQW